MIAHRLKALVEEELSQLQRELERASLGRDRSVHKARKTLQRLRAVVMLFNADRAQMRQENLRMQTLRRRLAPLRDAAARSETFRLLATRQRWAAWKPLLRTLAAEETERHAAAWARHGASAALWQRIRGEADALAQRAAHWPFENVDAHAIERAVDRAQQRMHKRIAAARGAHGRVVRHELRRKLRRYANLCRAASVALAQEDDRVERLLTLAQRCGHEGDLWMAVVSARRKGRGLAEAKALASELEAYRRRQCQRHDGMLKAF